MTIRVGIIGTGLIGEDHGRKLVNAINGSTVSAVSDINLARATEVAQVLGGAPVFDDGHDLIRSPEVDAVLVTSIGPTHAEFVLSCIDAGKPVMCEKPLAPTTPESGGRLRAASRDRRLHAPVRRGLPRRQGRARVGRDRRRVRAAQRPQERNGGRGVHELHDHDRFDDPRGGHHPVAARRGDYVGPGDPAEADAEGVPAPSGPQFAAFTTESGVLSTVEFFANCQYGYDVRCELVGSIGTASMVNPTVASTIAARTLVERIPADWRERFGAAYTAELQAWITGLQHGECVGPSAWEGYAATKVVEVGVEAVKSGQRMKIDYIEKPALYR